MDMDAILTSITTLASEWGFKLLGAIVLLLVGMAVIRFAVATIRKTMSGKRLDKTLVGFLCNVANGSLIAFLCITVLGILGVPIGMFAALLAAAGLVIGLALGGSLGNLASGLMLIVFRPFNIGDKVEIAGEMGDVTEIQIFCTVLKRADGKRVIVPNGQVTSASITNWTVEGKVRLEMTFGIGYDDDIRTAKGIMEKILIADERVLSDPAPTVAVSELGDSSVNFAVMPWVDPTDYWGVWFDTHEKIKYALDEAGISIPFPQRDVHMHQAA